MIVNSDRTILDDNFFTKFQQLGYIADSLHMFDDVSDVFDKDNDVFLVEYDETVDLHILLHESGEFGETRPICYLDQNNFRSRAYHPFIRESLKMAWAEYSI